MPYEETTRGKRPVGGFSSEPPPGMSGQPVAHAFVRTKTAEQLSKDPDLLKEYNQLARIIRIINRGKKGPMAGKPFAARFNSEVWPEGADDHDPASWLQPGEYMDVPKDVALHIVGNVWDPTLPSKMDIIKRYGDVEYEAPPSGKSDPRNASMTAVGPPPLPDLVVCEMGRGDQPASAYIAVFDLYCPQWARAEKELVKA